MNPSIYNDKRFGINQADISKNALSIISRLHKNGFDAFIVGGGIRDLIKGLGPKDFDIVTNCEPEKIRGLFKNSRIIGRRFKLVHIAFPNEIVETTTFRSGINTDSESIEINDQGRIISDNIYGTQEEDAYRRDLTINSIYYNPITKEIIDYTDGVKDLKERRIRFIGDAEKRIIEDPVRILRAIRFAAKLNFTIDKAIADAIDNHKHQLLQVPQARLYEEVIKLFMSGHALNSYILLQKHGIFDLIFPHVKNSADNFDDFYKKAFAQTDDRVKIGKKLNIGFLYATLLWPAIFIKSNIGQKINYKKFYQIIASSIRKQQTITSIPRRFTSFIKDTWMHQIRFDRIGKKSISFTQNIRFRAAYDFYLLRETLEPSLSQKIKWWTEFKAANYDKKVRLINSFKKYGKK